MLVQHAKKESIELHLIGACQIYINDCVIKVPSFLEERICTHMKKQHPEQNTQINLNECRLRVGAHNQWQMVNSAKLMNSIALSLDENFLRCSGIPTVDNAFLTSEMGIIFQLECCIKIRRRGRPDEIVSLILGETVCVPRLNSRVSQLDSFKISEAMSTESEKSITGAIIWISPDRIQGEDWTITLMCEISPRQGTVAGTNLKEVASAYEEKRKLDDQEKKQMKEIDLNETRRPKGVQFEKERENILKSKFTEKKMQTTDMREIKKKDFTSSPISPQKMGKTTIGITEIIKSPIKEQHNMPEAIITLNKYDKKSVEAKIISYQQKRERNAISEAIGREIPRGDQAFLGNQGVKSISEYTSSEFKIADIEDDKQDILKAATIFFEFISFKPKGALAENSDVLPKEMAFSFRFFTFPNTQTEAVYLKRIKGGNREGIYPFQVSDQINNWTNVNSVKNEAKCLRLEFDYDPQADKDIPAEKSLDDYLRYLAGNVLKIWVWDAATLIPLGECKVLLADLLRRRDPMRSVKKEYDVFSENRELIGSLQLLLQSIGRKQFEMKQKEEKVDETVVAKPKRGKKKIVSKPLTLEDLAKVPQMSLRVHGDTIYGKGEMLAAEERRKEEIVYAYKMHVNKSQAVSEVPAWQKQSILADIGKYRSVSRTLALSGLNEKGTMDRARLHPIVYTVGELNFQTIEFTNPYPKDTYFAFFLYDPEAKNEVQLVTDPNEWKYYCNKSRFMEPPDFTMLMNKSRFLMKAEEQIQLLLKIHSVYPPQKKERKMTITIQNVETLATEKFSEMLLSYKETYYNACFMFNEPENRPVDIILYPELHSEIFGKTKCIKCSHPNVEAKLIGTRIILSLVTPSSPNETEVFIYLYGDQYLYEAICVLYVIVKSYICYDINEAAGKRIIQPITIESISNKSLNE